jgi:hypothetical protein
VAESDLVSLITDVKESLERELGSLRHEMREGFAQVNSRLDAQALRLERQGMLWQTGRRWGARMDDWADKMDAALEVRDREIAELRARIVKLEGRANQ